MNPHTVDIGKYKELYLSNQTKNINDRIVSFYDIDVMELNESLCLLESDNVRICGYKADSTKSFYKRIAVINGGEYRYLSLRISDHTKANEFDSIESYVKHAYEEYTGITFLDSAAFFMSAEEIIDFVKQFIN